jgi:phosphate transport system permease protein
MILPTITAISQESIKSVPKEYRDASYSLGATRWETIKKCIIPIALPGILTGIILGIMRAMGETMAIVMLIGNSAKIPSSILDSGYAMTSKILNDIGYHIIVDDARAALFGIAAILFIIEIFFIGFIKIITRKRVL